MIKLFQYEFDQSACNAETKRRFRSGEKEAEFGDGFAWEKVEKQNLLCHH